MNAVRRSFASLAAAAMTFVTVSASAADPVPVAGPIAVSEVTEGAGGAGMDSAAIRSTADDEIALLDTSKLPAKKRYLVSLSVARSSVGDSVACTVNAMLRDAKTGAMIAIIEAGAQAAGVTSDEMLKRVAHAAVRSAMRRIPTALSAK